MDPINPSPADGLEVVHQNGVHDESTNSGEEGVVSYDLDPSVTETTETVVPNGKFENFNQSESTATGNSSTEEIEGSIENMDGNNMAISKEEDVKSTAQTEQPRAQKGPVKNKNAKVPSSSGVRASLVKSTKSGKDKQSSSSVSNGTSALEPRARQPTKTRSFNDRQSQLSKHPSKSNAASSEITMEKKKPKSLEKGPLDKVQGVAESSLSTNAEDAKPHRVGTLPNYGFSFRCGERAERRREFLSKMEEKIQAKEEEKSNIQAKTKESQEAELRRLRKSLTFKATPMPTFYQEPAPPKVELKKIPTTRAKSPKLGRKKNSTNSESDGNNSSSSLQGRTRMSLDEKVSQNNPTKGLTPVHEKKPQRKSLPPRLASEKTGSSNSAAVPASLKAINGEKTPLSSASKKRTSLSNVTEQQKTETTAASEEKSTLSHETNDVAPSDEPSHEESHVNGDISDEENPHLTLSQEPIASAH